MPTKFGPEENAIIVRFGGGVNTAAARDEINSRECVVGENLVLDSQSSAFEVRPPFDLLGTAPNGSEIRGFANLLKTDGTVSMLVQAGTAVYEWDGTSFSASKGTVSASAQLRGPLSQNWQLDDEVIITDLNLQEPVKKWDGTTFSEVSFTDEDGNAFGAFRAKYCIVDNERAMFANVYESSTNFPHLMVGAKRGDYTNITVANRPSSALNTEDPFYLVQPDLKAINSIQRAFGTTITSSKKGDLFKLTGVGAEDFAFEEFYPLSGASGDEGMVFIGNDIIYGRQGRIESVKSSNQYKDTTNDDLSIKVFPSIKTYDDWTLIYNQRNQRVYCFADTQAECWVLFKPMLDTELSPWSNWRTLHSTSMQPTAVMSMLDPADGLEYVYFGDENGNLYRMEGTGSSGDAGSENIRGRRSSASLPMTLNANNYQMTGWVKYESVDEFDLTITILYNGEQVFHDEVTVTCPASSNRAVYGGGYYYNDDNFYSQSLSGRLSRQEFTLGTGSEEYQVQINYEGTGQPRVFEVGLRFEETAA